MTVLFHRDNDHFFSAVHRDALRAVALRLPDNLAEATLRILERPAARTRGQALVQVLQNSPLRDITIDHEPTYAPVRGVEL